MALSTADKVLIEVLRQKKSDGAKKLTVNFSNKTWTLSGLSYRIRKVGRRHGRDKAYCEQKRKH